MAEKIVSVTTHLVGNQEVQSAILESEVQAPAPIEPQQDAGGGDVELVQDAQRLFRGMFVGVVPMHFEHAVSRSVDFQVKETRAGQMVHRPGGATFRAQPAPYTAGRRLSDRAARFMRPGAGSFVRGRARVGTPRAAVGFRPTQLRAKASSVTVG